MTQRTAMILAAGLGTRLRPLTDTMPKALVPYKGKPMIQTLMQKLRGYGFTRVVINLHHFADMLQEFIMSNNGFGIPDVVFSDERKMLLDTGGGIRHAHATGLFGDSHVLIHNVDIVSDMDLGRFYESSGQTFSSVPDTAADLLVSTRKASRYLLTDRDGRLSGWLYPEKNMLKRTGSGHTTILDAKEHVPDTAVRTAFSGIHCISQSGLSRMQNWPEQFSIIDFYLSIADTCPVLCTHAPEGTNITDVGKPEQLR